MHPVPDCLTWPDVSPMALYRFMEGLRWSLIACQADWPQLLDPLAGLPELIREKVNNRKAVSTVSSYYLCRVAFQAMLDWPNGFHRFLDAYQRRARRVRMTTSLGSCWRSLFNHWIQRAWLHPEFEFIQHAFSSYLWDGHLSLVFALRHERFRDDERLAHQWGLLNWEQTLRILDIPDGALLRSARTGSLRSAALPIHEMGERIFKRDQVLELEQRWKAGVPLEEACHWLGLLAKDVEKLAQLGALALSQGDPRQRSSQWLFSKQSLVEFAEAVGHNLKTVGNIQPFVRLPTALDYLKYVRVDSATLLSRIASGQLVGYKSRVWSDNLSKVYFQESTLEALLKLIPTEQGWLTERDIAQRVEVPVDVVTEWISTDLIMPIAQYGGSYYFDPDGSEAFCANCLTSAEAAQILEVDIETMMRKLVQPGRLNPLANPNIHGYRGYLFHRYDVESLKSA
jgi:hypothetical protein